MILVITPEQCRAARQLLNWTAQDLESASGMSARTISLFETSKRELRSDNMKAIIDALELAGIEFLPDGRGKGEGVRMKESRGTNAGDDSR
jgi:transcriptional regulator with XRE-family HTH domain